MQESLCLLQEVWEDEWSHMERQQIGCCELYIRCSSALVLVVRLGNWDCSDQSHRVEWNKWIKLFKFSRLRTINVLLPFVLSFYDFCVL